MSAAFVTQLINLMAALLLLIAFAMLAQRRILRLIHLFALQGLVLSANTLLVAVTRVAPDYAEGWHVRATVDAAGGNDGAAMLNLQKVISLNPRHFFAMAELASMLEDYGDKKGALAMYRKALALDPHLEGAARAARALEKEVEGQGI